MSHIRLALALPLALAASTGCTFSFGDDDPCDRLLEDIAPAELLRNPVTGLCESPGGGPGPCDVVPLADEAPGAPLFFPDWASCSSGCEGLDESTCQLSDGCRAAYRDPCDADPAFEHECTAALEFIGCWGTAPSGPIRGGGCAGLDAQSCSLHDDCSPVHITTAAGYGNFRSCIDEPSCGGIHALELRNPETGVCENWGGGCADSDALVPVADWANCESGCEALDQDTCALTDGCRGIYVDACPACDALILKFAACWGTAPSGPIRGGGCESLSAQECSRHDDCIAVHEQDWSLCPPGVPCTWTPLGFQWCTAEPS